MVKRGFALAAVALLLQSLVQHSFASAEAPGQQLRGQVDEVDAPPGTSAENPEEESPSGLSKKGNRRIWGTCSCEHGSVACECSISRLSYGENETKAMSKNLTEQLKNRTQGMRELWRKQDKSDKSVKGMHCTCMQGSANCQCGHEAEDKTLNATLKNETENLLSMWWAAHGGGYHPFHRMYHPMYHAGGCSAGRYGGCGCGYIGCHCAHGGYARCGWR